MEYLFPHLRMRITTLHGFLERLPHSQLIILKFSGAGALAASGGCQLLRPIFANVMLCKNNNNPVCGQRASTECLMHWDLEVMTPVIMDEETAT